MLLTPLPLEGTQLPSAIPYLSPGRVENKLMVTVISPYNELGVFLQTLDHEGAGMWREPVLCFR